METLQKLVIFLQPYGTASYLVIFGILILCGLGFPMPEDIILVTGGILASQGIIDPYVTFVVTMAGVLIGDFTMFFVGRKFGRQVRRWPLVKRILSEKRDQKVQKLFERFGDLIIFIARFLPGLRSPIFLSAGSYGVPMWKFFAYDGTAALISVPVWIWVGYFFGSNLETLETYVKRMQFSVLGLVALTILVLVLAYRLKKKFKAAALD